MARKVNLGNVNVNGSIAVSNNNLPAIDRVHTDENKIKETIEILLKINNKVLNYNIKQAAQALGVSAEFLRRRIAAGKIKTIYFGDKPMISIMEMARLINEGVK